MGHLLKTVNPEAAAALEATETPLPQQGQWVRYHCRPGEARSGRPTAPALVMHVDAMDRVCDLLVKHGPDDEVMQFRIRAWSPINDYHCFSILDEPSRESIAPPDGTRLDVLDTKLAVLENELRKSLREANEAAEHLNRQVAQLTQELASLRAASGPPRPPNKR
jgi:hypothetical protein